MEEPQPIIEVPKIENHTQPIAVTPPIVAAVVEPKVVEVELVREQKKPTPPPTPP